MRKLVFCVLLCSGSLFGAISHEINTTRPLCCTLSNKHHNRILVDQGRIKKVICPEDMLYVRLEEISGQVFIQAKFLQQAPTVISVITQEGKVQDIEMTFSDAPSQVIVLREPQPPVGIQEARDPPCVQGVYSVKSTCDAILSGEIPRGYCSVAFKPTLCKPKCGVTAKLVGVLRGERDMLHLYQVRNGVLWRRRIAEKEFASPATTWVYLQKHALCPKESILAIVAVVTNE